MEYLRGRIQDVAAWCGTLHSHVPARCQTGNGHRSTVCLYGCTSVCVRKPDGRCRGIYTAAYLGDIILSDLKRIAIGHFHADVAICQGSDILKDCICRYGKVEAVVIIYVALLKGNSDPITRSTSVKAVGECLCCSVKCLIISSHGRIQ